MKKAWKIVSLMMSLLLVLTVFISCGTNENDSKMTSKKWKELMSFENTTSFTISKNEVTNHVDIKIADGVVFIQDTLKNELYYDFSGEISYEYYFTNDKWQKVENDKYKSTNEILSKYIVKYQEAMDCLKNNFDKFTLKDSNVYTYQNKEETSDDSYSSYKVEIVDNKIDTIKIEYRNKNNNQIFYEIIITEVGSTTITLPSIQLHAPSDTWTYDEESHYHTCTVEGCSEIFDRENHQFNEGEVIEAATENKEGKIKYTCNVCHFEKEEVIPVVSGGNQVTKEVWEKELGSKDLSHSHYFIENTNSDGSKATFDVYVNSDSLHSIICYNDSKESDTYIKYTESTTKVYEYNNEKMCFDYFEYSNDNVPFSYDYNEFLKAIEMYIKLFTHLADDYDKAVFNNETNNYIIDNLPFTIENDFQSSLVYHEAKFQITFKNNVLSKAILNGKIDPDGELYDFNAWLERDPFIIEFPSDVVPSHTASDTWAYDEESHYHTCTVEGCSEIFDRENHQFDEGEVIEAATENKEGKIKYTCNVCHFEKEEVIPVVSGGNQVTKEVWEKELGSSDVSHSHYLLENTSVNGDKVISDIYSVNGRIYASISFNGVSATKAYIVYGESTTTVYEYNEAKNGFDITEYPNESVPDTYAYEGFLELMNSFASLFAHLADDFDKAFFDAETNSYVIDNLPFTSNGDNFEKAKFELTFRDGLLKKAVLYGKMNSYGELSDFNVWFEKDGFTIELPTNIVQ